MKDDGVICERDIFTQAAAKGNAARVVNFPENDRYWMQTLEAAQAMIAKGGIVCAHEYFREFFPGALAFISLDTENLRTVDWIIFHKDYIKHAAPGVMRRIEKDFTPVFANEVFVLFAGSRAAAAAPRREFHPAHVEALWVMVENFEKSSPSPAPGAKSLVETIREMRDDRSRWPADVVPAEEAGIVISACGRFFKDLHANLHTIRRRGCTLPVDVWHLPGEFTGRQIKALEPMANFIDAGITPFDGLSGKHEVHGFKAWMLSHSRFRRTLMLDVNSFPLAGLEAVFGSGEDCILWPDSPWPGCHETCSHLRSKLGLPLRERDFESGQLFADKGSPAVREALRLAAALNTLGGRLYDYTYGDKETYAIAFDLLRVPFRLAPEPWVHPPSATNYGEALGLVQLGLDGSALFYHPLCAKENWGLAGGEWAALEKEAAEAEAACR